MPASTRGRGGFSSRTTRFAAIHGRVCYHPCESSCNRAELDSAVSIHAVERFLGDLALERGWRFDPRRGRRSGRRVLVIGGRTQADSRPPTTWPGAVTRSRSETPALEPGGMMRYGIPAYRLPRDVLES